MTLYKLHWTLLSLQPAHFTIYVWKGCNRRVYRNNSKFTRYLCWYKI